MAILFFLSYLSFLVYFADALSQPNILFILTDDQDK